MSRRPFLISLLWIVAAILAVGAEIGAMGSVWARSAPDLILRLSPANGEALGRQFEMEILKPQAVDGLRGEPALQWQRRAQQALRGDPLQEQALRIFGMTLMVIQGSVAARPLMQLAETVSRRDLVTQTWLIESAVQDDDIAGAMSHYDRTLSVHPRMGDRLFPILASALSEPEIRRALVPYLRSDRPWIVSFLLFLARDDGNSINAMRMFEEYGGSRRIPSHRPLETELLQTLVRSGHVPAAWRYARTMASDEAKLRAFSVNPVTLDPALRPFSWLVSGDPAVAVEADEKGGLSITVAPGARALAASRTVAADAGTRKIQFIQEMPPLSPMSQLEWEAQCVGADRPFWSFTVPTRQGASEVSASLSVPAACPGITFNLFAHGRDRMEASRATIRELRLSGSD